MGESRVAATMDKIISLSIDPTWYDINKDLGFGAALVFRDVRDGRAPTKLSFLSLDLEGGIEESSAVNYADFDVVGRAEAYKSYMGSGNREIPLVFKFRAQGLGFAQAREARWERAWGDFVAGRDVGDVGKIDAETTVAVLEEEVLRPALWLDALKQPWTGTDGLSHAPPPCLLTLGRLFAGRVVATDVQISWQPPFDTETLLAHGADVSCTFAVVRKQIDNYSYGMRR